MRILAALACLSLAACSPPPGQYRIGLHDAYERLAASDFAGFMRERQCGILVHLQRTRELPDHAITWRILSSGREMLNFTATLTPVSDAETKVEISVFTDPDGSEAYDGTDFYRRPALKQPLRPALEEQVASLMQGRAYDVANVTQEPKDEVCLIQRGGLETGTVRFSVNDGEDEP
jgi:hypothetical protein